MIIQIVTTHQTPDTDALSAAAALWWCLAPGATPQVNFDSSLSSAAHVPAEGHFVVDIGLGELDHHQFDDPRSACAFGLVVEYIATHGTAEQQARAVGLRALIPLVLAQDSTGRIFDDPDQQQASLPAMLNRLVWAHQDDQAAWRDAWTILRIVFDAVAGNGEAPKYWMRQDSILRALDGDGKYQLAQFLVDLDVQETRARTAVASDPHAVCSAYGVQVIGNVASYEVSLTAGRFGNGHHKKGTPL